MQMPSTPQAMRRVRSASLLAVQAMSRRPATAAWLLSGLSTITWFCQSTVAPAAARTGSDP